MAKVKKATTVRAPVDLVYRAWHNFENFPMFMDNIEEVRTVSGGRSHWKAKAPLGTKAEWDAEVTLDEPNRAIGWRSIQGAKSGIETAGRVNFTPRDGATDLDVTIEYQAPAGVVGEAIAKIFSNPERQVEEDLQRFKETIEKGAELSGLTFEMMPPSGEASDEARYGGSLGGATDTDLERMRNTNSGITPESVDEPSSRAS